MRRHEWRSFGVLVTAGALLAATWHPLIAQTQQVTFDFKGQSQPWVVPSNVTSIQVDARGAQGGGHPEALGPQGKGGKGGRVQTTFSVTPGETLVIHVGGRGGDLSLTLANTAGAGGFNGGGSGGIDNVDFNAPAGGGGGASDVRQNGDSPANRVVVAGGGGGADCCDGFGGVGGGTTGMPGGAISGQGSYSASPGRGGTQSNGGAGGVGCNGNGGSGSPGRGGAGGNGNRAGGGGGGGYYGGGGGGGCFYGAGGGGGSSYSAGTGTIDTPGYQAGAGQVVITYSRSADSTLSADELAFRSALQQRQSSFPILAKQPISRTALWSGLQGVLQTICSETSGGAAQEDEVATVCAGRQVAVAKYLGDVFAILVTGVISSGLEPVFADFSPGGKVVVAAIQALLESVAVEAPSAEAVRSIAEQVVAAAFSQLVDNYLGEKLISAGTTVVSQYLSADKVTAETRSGTVTFRDQTVVNVKVAWVYDLRTHYVVAMLASNQAPAKVLTVSYKVKADGMPLSLDPVPVRSLRCRE